MADSESDDSVQDLQQTESQRLELNEEDLRKLAEVERLFEQSASLGSLGSVNDRINLIISRQLQNKINLLNNEIKTNRKLHKRERMYYSKKRLEFEQKIAVKIKKLADAEASLKSNQLNIFGIIKNIYGYVFKLTES